jgi:hypothetical protein
MIGASEVGSVVPLVKEGQTVKKVSAVAPLAIELGRLVAQGLRMAALTCSAASPLCFH